MHIISESVLMLLTESYQNWSMLDEATASQSWRIFLRRCRSDVQLHVINTFQFTNSSRTTKQHQL